MRIYNLRPTIDFQREPSCANPNLLDSICHDEVKGAFLMNRHNPTEFDTIRHISTWGGPPAGPVKRVKPLSSSRLKSTNSLHLNKQSGKNRSLWAVFSSFRSLNIRHNSSHSSHIHARQTGSRRSCFWASRLHFAVNRLRKGGDTRAASAARSYISRASATLFSPSSACPW